MKWYSIKEYTPLCDTDCLIMTVYGCIEVAEFIGDLEDPDVNLSVWIKAKGCYNVNTEEPFDEIHGVTHFCIPEPVPRELEND